MRKWLQGDDEYDTPKHPPPRGERKKVLVYKRRALQFAAICRTPPESLDATISQPSLPFDLEDGVLTDRMLADRIVDLKIHAKVAAEGSPPLLTASIIPDTWPLFWARPGETQSTGRTPRILYQRQSPTDRARIDHVIEVMRNAVKKRFPNIIGWIGSPGIAKSGDLNEVLRYFLQHMGERRFPRLVGLRINGIVVMWRWNEETKTIKVKEELGEAGARNSLYQVTQFLHKYNGLLLLVPEENDPPFTLACTTLVVLPNSNANRMLEYNTKKEPVRWMVAGSWGTDECQAAAWVEFMTGRRDLGSSWPAVASTVAERWSNVGGIPRFVLGTDDRYQKQAETLKNVTIKDLDLHPNIFSAGINPFVAPEPDITAKLAHFSWQFLSEARREIFWKLGMNVPDLAQTKVRTLALRWQMAESYISRCLCTGQTHDWKWYHDPGVKKLDVNNQMPGPPVGFRALEGKSLFEGAYLQAEVKLLDPTRLYYTHSRLCLGKFFSVSPTEKTVFLYHLSTELPATNGNGFKYTQIIAMRRELKMPPKWKLAIVYFLDKPREQMKRQPTGLTFKDDRKKPKLEKLPPGRKHKVSFKLLRAGDIPSEFMIEGYLVYTQLCSWDPPAGEGKLEESTTPVAIDNPSEGKAEETTPAVANHPAEEGKPEDTTPL